ncbi:hypothetical protein PYCCODRAFT_1425978 [Trametes coccinea BRFM310]|uniref:C2H2-type domain-containing protein n=1 Tax=Trametes coccinea (strain BRFM310) TaxID=1353009 RepID=A0A1Y2ILJ8_TRAC3|nr:hypothetical protein PYCCODRAFT_1425978 [Trametes coccinea BRFM310]
MYSAPLDSSMSDNDFERELEWLELTGNATTASPDNSLSLEAFSGFVDNSSSDLAHISMALDPDYDWQKAFVLPTSLPNQTHESVDGSVYSDTATSASSWDTSGPPTPCDAPLDTSEDGYCPLTDPAIPYYPFTFEFPPVMFPSPSPYVQEAFPAPLDAHYGQPQQQFLPGTVAVAVCADVGLQADTSTTLLPPPAAADREPSAVLGASGSTSKRRAGAKDGEDENVVVNTKRAKRPRKQSTEKTLKCPVCGSGWARQNNLDVHIKSLHEGKREHKCAHPRCGRAFSRKHDAKRHFQSEHTDMGSPRKKPATRK